MRLTDRIRGYGSGGPDIVETPAIQRLVIMARSIEIMNLTGYTKYHYGGGRSNYASCQSQVVLRYLMHDLTSGTA